MIYAVTLAFFAVFLRTAFGHIKPAEPLPSFQSGIPAAYYSADTTLTVYHKGHVRAAAAEFVLFGGFFLGLFWAVQSFLFKKLKKLYFQNPYLPALFFVILITTLPYPPFKMDAEHWSHFIGPSVAFLEGDWPYFDVFSYYGFLPIILLSGWISVFGAAPLSLAILLSMLITAAALFMYETLGRLTRSPLAAFLGTSLLLLYAYDHADWALHYVNHSALRFHFFISLMLWSAFRTFAALENYRPAAYGYAFLCGLLATWGPAEGVFTLIGMTLILGVYPKLKNYRCYGAFIAGFSVLPLVALIAKGTLSGLLPALSRIADFLAIFPQGYGNLPQSFDALLFFDGIMLLTLAGFCVKAVLLNQSKNLEFSVCVFSLVLNIPFLLQAMSRGAVAPYASSSLLWISLPAFLMIFVSPFKELGRRTPPLATAILVVTLCGVLDIKNPVSLLLARIKPLVVGQEPLIFKWALDCAEAKSKNLACAPVAPYTLNGLYAKEKNFSFTGDPEFNHLVDLCKTGTPIVDGLDSFVYFVGKCRPRHAYPAFFSLSTQKQVDEYLKIISDGSPVYFGKSIYDYQNRLLTQIKDAWLARGKNRPAAP